MTIESLRHKLIADFHKEISEYDISEGFRMYNGVDLYKEARLQIKKYYAGSISLEDIFNNPDNELRNLIKLWPIDRQKLVKR